ncbi:hypothetical protein ACFLZ1_01240 [Patescibacteria group bacterium]
MKKPSNCPKCESKKILVILYGLIDPKYKLKDDEMMGGCMPTDAKWHCADCDWEWGYKWSGAYNPIEDEEID